MKISAFFSPRIPAALAGLLFLAGLAGCTPVYRADLNAYLAQGTFGVLGPGSSVHVETPKHKANPLLAREVAAKLSFLLAKRGFRLAGADTAQYLIGFDYHSQGVLASKLVTYHEPDRYYTVYRRGRDGHTHPVLIQVPGAVRYSRVPVRQQLRRLVVKAWRRTGRHLVWVADVVSQGYSRDLRTTLDPMLMAAVDSAGINTGRQITVRVPANNPRLMELRGMSGGPPRPASPPAAPRGN